MSKLKAIVPEYNECLNIPSNAFTDTALVWVEDEDGIELVLPREVAQYEHDEMTPRWKKSSMLIAIWAPAFVRMSFKLVMNRTAIR